MKFWCESRTRNELFVWNLLISRSESRFEAKIQVISASRVIGRISRSLQWSFGEDFVESGGGGCVEDKLDSHVLSR